MEMMQIDGDKRVAGSKGFARRVRAAGQIPGIIYGNGVENTPISVDPKALAEILRTEYGFNNVFTVNVGGASHNCMVKDYQFDSVRREITHVDLYVVQPEQFIVTSVPVKAIGNSVGVKMGGRLQIVTRDVRVRCAVKDIPATVDHDVTKLAVSESVYIDEITPPQGCTFEFNHRFPVIRIARKRGAVIAATADAADGAGAEAATPEAE